MILVAFSSLETAVANHLWQSTAFGLCAALLTLPLRKNQARIRYALWLAASMKFLLPFALLSWLGSLVAGMLFMTGAHAFVFTVIEVSQPFSRASQSSVLAAVVAIVWVTGCVTVIALFASRWVRAAAAVRSATPVFEGREVMALRASERRKNVGWSIPIHYSQATLEPAVVGVLSPVLLWPEKLSVHLSDAHIEAIAAHEIEHVRRRDNLTAILHMLVQTLFWFHPFVWWLGARLIDERERACDEAVLQLGATREIYAESILKTCEYSLSSPLACISGVTTGALKQRIKQIMSAGPAARLGRVRTVMLIVVCIGSIGGPIVVGAESEHIYHFGDPGVSPPKLVYAPDPEYTDQARKRKYQGVCVVALTVNEEGKPVKVKVERHLRFGLDQKAADVVKQYKFVPATLNGKPVPIAIHVEVNYRIY